MWELVTCVFPHVSVNALNACYVYCGPLSAKIVSGRPNIEQYWHYWLSLSATVERLVIGTAISTTSGIGVNITASGRKLTLFQHHPAFPLFTENVPLFFAYFELEKMRSMRFAQRRQPASVFDKANSLCEVVNRDLYRYNQVHQ